MLKSEIRRTAMLRRAALENKDEISARIVGRLIELPEYVAAAAVLWYVDARSEVRTRLELPAALASGKQIVVPYCQSDELRLFRLESLAELVIGAYGILEPPTELRERAEKRVLPAAIDLAIVPGVAFDRSGTRLGHGFGYYDKLLAQLSPDTPRIGLAFECQLFDELPRDEHDVAMSAIVTESAVYRC